MFTTTLTLNYPATNLFVSDGTVHGFDCASCCGRTNAPGNDANRNAKHHEEQDEKHDGHDQHIERLRATTVIRAREWLAFRAARLGQTASHQAKRDNQKHKRNTENDQGATRHVATNDL